ncbi:1074_t:CDS:2, partial [Funneliformis caledonium]
EQPQFSTTADKQIEIEKILLILDNIYDSIGEGQLYFTSGRLDSNSLTYGEINCFISWIRYAVRTLIYWCIAQMELKAQMQE